ncbi:hypothetical protein CEXT_766321 [Caerostris extrusa]|uniref:Uncharacterized protein n=1 Tax=Caerostris extrusa TaxID=172846 RepID=A0AAV4UD42_CAEEX|nr:hypothetical protein CEXT_766321 [Caerostris extrusa]
MPRSISTYLLQQLHHLLHHLIHHLLHLQYLVRITYPAPAPVLQHLLLQLCRSTAYPALTPDPSITTISPPVHNILYHQYVPPSICLYIDACHTCVYRHLSYQLLVHVPPYQIHHLRITCHHHILGTCHHPAMTAPVASINLGPCCIRSSSAYHLRRHLGSVYPPPDPPQLHHVHLSMSDHFHPHRCLMCLIS